MKQHWAATAKVPEVIPGSFSGELSLRKRILMTLFYRFAICVEANYLLDNFSIY